MTAITTMAILVMCAPAPSVRVYEFDVLPETVGWERELGDTPGAERAIVDGWFVQSVGLPNGWEGPFGDADFYRMPVQEFVGADRFFMEWCVLTDNPATVLDYSATPVALVAGGTLGVVYHTTVTDTAVELFRTTQIPIVTVAVEGGIPHKYRVELTGSVSFEWYIDGKPVHSGVPRAAYPDSTASFIWGVRRSYVDSTTRWDYIRFGVIPQDGSGDYDSDGDATLFDHYFVRECVADGGPDINAGPGCRFTDFDGDTDADLLDFAEFQNLFGPLHP